MKNRDQIIPAYAAPVLLLLIMGVYAWYCINFTEAPFEDAAILMRYAGHFAHGHGIVWNIGEKPVDGATDFLFMIIIGLQVKLGLGLEFAVHISTFIAHILTILLVWHTQRTLFKVNNAVAFLTTLYLAVGPALSYIAEYFGTPFFALFAALSWYCVLQLITGEIKSRTALSFALLSLVTSLIRPEGVILTALMLVTIVVIKGWKTSLIVIYYYTGIFLLLGGSYFIWRWNYFGYPLPNPFYKKGGFHPIALFSSQFFVFKMCLPVLPVFLYGLYNKGARKTAIALLIPAVGFAFAFLFLSEEMNFGGRFQYAILPMVLMAWPVLIWNRIPSIKFPGETWLAVLKLSFFIILAALVIFSQYKRARYEYFQDGRYKVARILADYADKHYTLATSEAGLLPLYSGWRTLDTWGLNDQWIAHNGNVTEEYIDAFKSHVIMFRAEFSPVKPFQGGSHDLLEMVMTLKAYAEKHNYILAAAYGDNPQVAHYYYIRSDFPAANELVARIRNVTYFWVESGNKAKNYALIEKP